MIEYENLKNVNALHKKELTQAFKNVLNSGHYILGNAVKQFEEDFAAWTDGIHCIGVASGLDALTLSLAACNFKKGSEVIVASNTYIATILAILHNGLTPVLVEPNINTYNIDTTKIEQKISKKTVAIIAVHLYGLPCEMYEITQMCRANKLKLIEDCAQAHGAQYDFKHVGNFGDFGCFSFYPTKNLGALGDGGAIICNNKKHKNAIEKLRNYGSSKKYYNDLVGYNSRLDELQAALLSVKLEYIADTLYNKWAISHHYSSYLSTKFTCPVVPSFGNTSANHIYCIRHPKRNKLRKYLLENGIKTEIHYPVPPHKQKAMQGIIKGKYPIAEELANTSLSLPISAAQTIHQTVKITNVLNSF